MEKEFILKALQEGNLKLQGQFVNSSNYTFLTNLVYQDVEMSVVYKPVQGETPLWDFDPGTLAKREVAAYWMSEALRWNLVPPTVFRRDAVYGSGSVQLFVDHDPAYHYFEFGQQDIEQLRPAAAFDILINNADRKGGHILKDTQNERLFLIDHGVCFHVETKLRTVVWNFAGQDVPAELLQDVERVLKDLISKQDIYQQLLELLRKDEITALMVRCEKLLEEKCYPRPDPYRRVYPWPPI